MSTSRCGEIFRTPPKCLRKERAIVGCIDFYSHCSNVAAAGAMSWRRCESETTFFGLPKEDTIRNQWLSCIYNTVPEQYNANIRVCALRNSRRTISWTWQESSLACSKAVSIKWGNSNFARTVWRFWLTACKYVSASDDSNASFEQCRVVLVVCHFSDHKCRHGNVASRRVKRQYKSL